MKMNWYEIARLTILSIIMCIIIGILKIPEKSMIYASYIWLLYLITDKLLTRENG